jgi:hypothetical protein
MPQPHASAILAWDRPRLCREANSILLCPGPWQQFIDFMHGPAVDELVEDIGQISPRVNFVELCGFNERCDTCQLTRPRRDQGRGYFSDLMQSGALFARRCSYPPRLSGSIISNILRQLAPHSHNSLVQCLVS